MSLLRFIVTSTAVAGAIAVGAASASAATCAPKGAEPVDTIRAMYAGAMAGDRAKTLAAFDRDAFLFDVGERYTPESLTDLILKIEAAGTKLQWNVDDAESHAACDLAWAAWTNHGVFTTAAGAAPKTWLESAVFVWRDGAWKIRFLHSTPVDTPPAHS